MTILNIVVVAILFALINNSIGMEAAAWAIMCYCIGYIMGVVNDNF